ncbi:hypothetical protein ETU08_00010, partial [Apibacter muscae]|uniref:hypothetical protein n=1 Tax=Apibacter muscae TaxID=2509004 RepID=UPI0011AD0E75
MSKDYNQIKEFIEKNLPDNNSNLIEPVNIRESIYQVLDYLMENSTQSTQGATGTPFPSNPKVGDYFSYIDDNGNIEEVYQFDGDTWKLFIRHKLNFEIMFNDESFMYYNEIGKLQNFVGYDNYSISKFNIDENNLT